MIKNKFITIKISKKNIEHFKCHYKDIKLGDIIQIDPSNLQKNSNIRVDVICDICGIERNIKNQSYIKNINSCSKYPIYTCDKCSHIKIKEFNKKKWGVDYYSQTEEYGDKFRSTMLYRYGVEYALQSEELKEKAKKKNLEKLGVENPFMDSEMIQRKFKEKWGVSHPSKVPELKEKAKQTMLSKWGVEYSLQNKVIKNKMINTNRERYKSDHFMQSEFCDSYIKSHRNYIKYLGSNISMFSCDCGDCHNFEMSSDNFHNRMRSNLPLCTICNPIGECRSIKEEQLYDFIMSIYSGIIIQSYRDGLEIDIYLPELEIGFEFNGLFWHSEEWKHKNYHLDKTNYFKDKGIRIIHIWEDDWTYKQEIVKSQIKNWINLSVKKISARKCQVKEIKDVKLVREFLNSNHLQGFVNSNLKLGLYYNSDLISMMSFDHLEGRKKMSENEWNLNRFCNKVNTNVVGGASKLLSYFIKTYKPKRIISYADKDWSQGGLYKVLGFNVLSESVPDYKYVVDNRRRNKQNFKKSNLKIVDISEGEFMKKSHIKKIWDCGKIKFEKLLVNI